MAVLDRQFHLGDVVVDAESGMRGIVKWNRDGPYVQTDQGGTVPVGARWTKSTTVLSTREAFLFGSHRHEQGMCLTCGREAWECLQFRGDWDESQRDDGRFTSGGSSVADRMAALKEQYPVVAKNYARHSGTEMGTIEAHTGDVGREWAKQLTDDELAGISDRFGSDVQKLMATAIPLHDIGKADALEIRGGKRYQHEHTVPILQDVLTKEGFGKKDIALATELLNHDLLGPLVRGRSTATSEAVAAKLEAKAEKVGMAVADFVTLQLAFYQADASSYPYVTQFMTQEASGKWTFKGAKPLAAIEALLQAKHLSQALLLDFDEAQHPRDDTGRFTDGGGGDGSSAEPKSQDLGRERPKPIKAKTVSEAVSLILKGEVVELREISHVHTVLEKLAAIAREAEAKGEAAPQYDLCNVSIKGSNLFCGDKLRTKEFPNGVPRLKMPQFAGKPVPGSPADKLPKTAKGRVVAVDAFVDHLTSLGIKTTRSEVPAAHLRATQSELIGATVAGMMTAKGFDPADEPIFISRDDYIVDGHHRWAAVVGRDAKDGRLGDSTMRVVKIDAPISELLHRANTWSKAFGMKGKATTKLSVRGVRMFALLNDPRFLDLGDLPGHPFRGNQYTDGEGGSASERKERALAAVKQLEHAPNPHQPIDPPHIPAQALGKAKALVATETEDHKIPIEDVLDAMDGDARQQFDALYAKTEKANAELIDIMTTVDSLLGEEALVKQGPIKTLDRAVKKVVGKDAGDARNVRDVVRASVAVDHVSKIPDAIAAVHEAVKRSGGELVNADDKFAHPLETGYRDFSFNVRLPSGVIAEVQVHLKQMLEAKTNEGHALYTVQRKVLERGFDRPLTSAEQGDVDRLNREQRKIYGAAWTAGGGT